MSSRSVRRRRQAARTNRLWLLGGLAAIVAVALVVIVLNNGSTSAATVVGPPPAAPLDKCGSAACGDAKAPVTLDVYADFQCPYCKQFEPVLQQLATKYIDTGKVRLVYHNFTLIGPESETAAQAALCAGDQNRFWMFANDLFSHQGAENSGVFTASNLKGMAAGAGLNASAFNSCLDSGKYVQAVSDQRAQGQSLGVKATPTFFINGQISEGGVSFAQLSAMIDAALAK